MVVLSIRPLGVVARAVFGCSDLNRPQRIDRALQGSRRCTNLMENRSPSRCTEQCLQQNATGFTVNGRAAILRPTSCDKQQGYHGPARRDSCDGIGSINSDMFALNRRPHETAQLGPFRAACTHTKAGVVRWLPALGSARNPGTG
jgi:hypothetical protein